MSRTKPQSYPNRQSSRAATLDAGNVPASSSGALSAIVGPDGRETSFPCGNGPSPGSLTIREAAGVLWVGESNSATPLVSVGCVSSAGQADGGLLKSLDAGRLLARSPLLHPVRQAPVSLPNKENPSKRG